MTLIGIDISYYDPILFWADYTWDFAFIKASEGIVPDRLFLSQWKAAQGRTIRGTYHYFHPAIDPKVTSQKFVQLLGDDIGELPPALDMETTNGLPPAQVAESGLTWLHNVNRMTGKRPIVYTSPNFINIARLFDYQEYRDYPLWLAEYPRDRITVAWTESLRSDWIFNTIQTRTIINPKYFPPFRKIDWFQWTGKCPPDFVPGYPLGKKLAVDISFFLGTMEDMISRYDIHYIPKGDDNMSTMPITMEADLKTGAQSNFRYDYGLSGGFQRTLTGPLHIKCIGNKMAKDGYQWSEVVFIDDAAVHGWIAWTTSYENVVIHTDTTIPSTTKKIVKSTLFFDDNTTIDLFPTQ